MYNELFVKRLTELRLEKGVSARDMSLSLGQNAGYINNIESGKALPSMSGFFYICEYLGVTPAEFFAFDQKNIQALKRLDCYLHKLNSKQVDLLIEIAENIVDNDKK